MPARIPTQKLLDELRRLGEELSKQPSARDMKKRGAHSPYVYQTRFGSWKQALITAGFEGREPDNLDREQLISGLRTFADELGKPPTESEMSESGPYSTGTYRRQFGTWDDALREAELGIPDRNPNEEISQNDLISELLRLAGSLDRTPKREDMDQSGKYSSNPYSRKFGSWNDALKSAGLTVNIRRSLTEGELKEAMHRFASEIGYTPRQREMEKHGPLSARTYSLHFGSWNSALRECGFEVNKPEEGMGKSPNEYGENWPRQRRKALERDGYQCTVCGMSNDTHSERFGKGIHVHHITPLREFEDTDEAHELENLRTLCQPCHNQWEGIPVAPVPAE